MFGVIKRIFRKAEPAREVAAPVATDNPIAAPADRTEVPPLPAQRRDEPEANAILLPKPSAPTNGDYLSLSYAAILRQMPKELYGRLAPEGLTGSFFMVPRQQVVEQLPRGSVKVPFGELRRAAPIGVFTNNSAHDSQMVDLPLAEIIPQLPTESYQRRAPVETLIAPDEVTDIFGPKGQCLSEMRVVPKGEAARKPAGAPNATPGSYAPFQPGLGAPPGTGRAPAAPAAYAPPSGMPTSFPSRTTPPRTVTPPPSTPAPAAPPTTPMAPARAVAPAALPARPSAAGVKALPKPLPKAAPAAPVLPKTPNFNPPPESTELRASPFLVELAELASTWPDAIREEVAQIHVPHVRVELPPATVCEGLKNGRVHFTWGELRAWVVGAPQAASMSPHSATDLDLPLNVLTPLFLEYIRATQLNRKVASAEHITEFFRRATGKPAPNATVPNKPAASPASAPLLPAAGGETMSVSLSLITPGWHEAILQEIQQHSLGEMRIELPIDAVETKLRTGKAEFSWQQLATWIPGCPDAVLASAHGEISLSLPLSVLAPMFLKKRGSAVPQRRPLSDMGIPDVFATPGKPPPATEPPPTSTPTTSAPVSAPAPTPPPVAAPTVTAPVPRKPAANLAELFGEPGKKTWTPKELVHGVKRLPGVTGCLIALQDGLLVAHSMPENWKSEAMAAFLPQIFGRINQYGKELNTGDAKAVAITTDAGTLQVYLAGIVYLAALGEPGNNLPLSDLQLVAGELSRRSQ